MVRGGLDETLARMARREEALRRVTEPPVGREAGAHRQDPHGPPVDDPVEEVAEAVRRVVAAHPGLTVTVRVEHDGQAYPLRIGWAGDRVTVALPEDPPDDAARPAGPPPPWPMSVKTVPAWTTGQREPGPDQAARLAELIRRDPSLLGGHDPRR
ncbi:hypothetical protein GA0070620_4877 [Micromonospora krabiensis]|uniref:Uncharacterized protein n=1 Tax=Micromonospora krabiensis TaxID=307121 RepID=A0A1C3N9N0_9ACTN|nr:hypothetical protein GA0070620_4877 [Micromonospora krabiensis]